MSFSLLVLGCGRVDKQVKYDRSKHDIFMAAKAGDAAAVGEMLDEGANPNAKDKSGRPLFVAAAAFKHEQVMGLLARRGADIDVWDDKGNAAIHYVVLVKWPEGVRVLKSLGAKINARNGEGWTALRLAVELGLREQIAEELLKSGADVTVPDYSGYTPIHAAVQEGYVSLAKRMLASGGKEDIYLAAYFGHMDVVKRCLESGVKVSDKDGRSYTPLHWAAHGGQPDVAQYLISRGADVSASNSFGYTPLHLAVGCIDHQPGRNIYRSAAVARLLINSGADQNAAAENGQTPAMYAQQSGVELPQAQ